MKALWISPGFAADENDTTCIPVLQTLALAMKSIGIEIFIMTIDYPHHTDRYLWDNIPVKSNAFFKIKLLKWYNWYRAYQYGVRLQKEKHFDMVHSFWLGPAWLIGKAISKKHKIPHLTTSMGQDVLPSNRYRFLIQPEDLKNIITVSAYQAKVFFDTFHIKPLMTIEWGLNASELPGQNKGIRPIDILGCGSLIKLKNWKMWIEIVSALMDQDPNLNASLIGDGPDKNKLERQIRILQKQNRIKLLGALSRSEVFKLMADSKVLLHTSLYESYGLVMAEARAMGCSVVSTPVGIAVKICLTNAHKEGLIQLVKKCLSADEIIPAYEINSIHFTASQYKEVYSTKIELFKKETPG